MSRGDDQQGRKHLTIGQLLSSNGHKRAHLRSLGSHQKLDPAVELLDQIRSYAKKSEDIIAGYEELVYIETQDILDGISDNFFKRYPQLEAFGFSVEDSGPDREPLTYSIGSIGAPAVFMRNTRGALVRFPGKKGIVIGEFDLSGAMEIQADLQYHLQYLDTNILCVMMENHDGWSLARARNGITIMLDAKGGVLEGEDLEITGEIRELSRV